METMENRFFSRLESQGMPKIPDEFSVVPSYQVIPKAILAEIDQFIHVFERVTTRPAWQQNVTASSPDIVRQKRPEHCFFSAWDLHIPMDQPDNWQMIEFNDNGSGLLFAECINRVFYESLGSRQKQAIQAPQTLMCFSKQIAAMVDTETREFFSTPPQGFLLILDDKDSLQQGWFRRELGLLQGLLERSGRKVAIASPSTLYWDGKYLYCQGLRVSFIVNRCTDFLWQAAHFAALRSAYHQRRVYVAPNPFSYASRSDKRLMEFLSHPDWDQELGILAQERAVLSAHVPKTLLIAEDNLEDIARHKAKLFFKPASSFAGRGILKSEQLGQSRLRRLLKSGQAYVAQTKIPKSLVKLSSSDAPSLWCDLRVWAYRGRRFMLSGRASRRADILDLSPPGGWLPTYAQC